MFSRFKPPIHTLAILLLAASPVFAGTLRFVDSDGAPVANVVVEVIGQKPLAKPAAPIMDQVDRQFVPHVLTVLAGESVSFPNSDNIRHHVYSFSTPKVFEIKLFKGTEAAPVTFDTPGIVVLGCNIHDSMVGYIYVAAGNLVLLSDDEGVVTLPAGEFNVWVWHSRLSAEQNKRLKKAIAAEQQQVVLELLPEKPTENKRSFKSRYRPGGG